MMEEYQGWSSYETFAVNRDMTSNAHGTLSYWRNASKNLDSIKLADKMERAYFGDGYVNTVRGTIFGELLLHSLSRVNWDQIAGSFKNDAIPSDAPPKPPELAS